MGGKQSKSLIKKLEERDVVKIKLVFNDLAAPNRGKGIDIDTFKQFSQLSDMVAERAFVLFASKKPTLIDLEEFTGGLGLCHRGSDKEKLKAIYKILAVHTDKVSKDEVAVVLNAAVTSPTWNTHTREDLKPPTELVQKLIEMGFPRAQCDKAVEVTKATNVDDAVAWIVNNKPDSLADANVLLTSMFDGHTDNHTNWRKFKKWAQSSSRPREFMGFLNGFPMLYERAILWSTAAPQAPGPVTVRPITPTAVGAARTDTLIDFTIDDTKPVVAHATATVKEPKRRSHRSLSHLMNRRSVDSMQPAQQPTPVGLGVEPAFLSDLTLAPTTPTLVPTPLMNQTIHSLELNPAAPTNLSAPSSPVLPRQPSQQSNTSSAPTTPSGAPPPPSTATTSFTSSSPGIRNRTMSHQTLNPSSSLSKKPSSTNSSNSDGWSSDDDDDTHSGKPVIQVVIKDKSTIESAKPADLKKAVSSLILADMPKAGQKQRGHSSMGSGRRARPTKFALESSFFDPNATDAELAQKARDSLGEDMASGTSTPSGTPPLTSISGPGLPATPTQMENPTPPETPPANHPDLRLITPQNGTIATNPVTSQASEYMRAAMALLEKGNFPEALKEVDKSLSAMLETGDAQAVKGEANFCVAYKVALGILVAIRELEGKFAAQPTSTDLAKRLSFLSKILSDIPLKTNHRIVCVRMAISKNMHPQAPNYAVAARLVEALLLKGAPDREALQEKLKKCKENETDSSLPPYTCPYCSQQCSAAALKCSCSRPVRWCFKTYELITTKNYLQCSFCNALVSPAATSSVTPGDKCDFCNYGSFAER